MLSNAFSPLQFSWQELKDVGHRDQMAAARGILQKNVPILYTASQACLQHPDVAAYKANRDLIYKQLQQAVSGISNAAQATASDDAAQQQGGGGELAYALNNFDVSRGKTPPVPAPALLATACFYWYCLEDHFLPKCSEVGFFKKAIFQTRVDGI